MNSKFYFLISFFLALLIAKPSSSQVSDGTVRSTIKSKCVNDPSTLLKIEFNKGSTKKELESSGWVYYHTRSYTLKFSTPYSGINYFSEGSITFKKKSGSYYYMNHAVYKRYYTGIPKPNIEEVNKAINEINPETIIEKQNRIVSIEGDVTVAPDTEWYWTNYNSVRFAITFTTTSKEGHTLFTRKTTHTIDLKRSKDGDTFNKDEGLLTDGKWLNIKECNERIIPSPSDMRKGKIEEISKRELTDQEYVSIQTLEEKYYENKAKKRWESLKPLELPEFKYANEVRLFVFQTLWEGDTSKIKSMVFQMMPTREMGSNFFSEWSNYVLTANGEAQISDAIKKGPLLKNFYCKTPIYRQKKDSYGYMGDNYFWCKKMKLTSRIYVKEYNNKWYLTGFRLRVKGDIDTYNNLPDSLVQCGQPAYFLSDEDVEFKVGDHIQAKTKGKSWYNEGTIEEVHYSTGKYKVKIGNDRNAYTDVVPAEFVKIDNEYEAPSTKKETTSNKNTENDDNKNVSETKKKKKKKKKKIKPKIKLGGFKIGG